MITQYSSCQDFKIQACKKYAIDSILDTYEMLKKIFKFASHNRDSKVVRNLINHY